MSRKKVWTASQAPSSVSGDSRTAAIARVSVRPQPYSSVSLAEAPASVSPPTSAAQRPTSGPGKACLAAVLAAAAAKPHNQPAACGPQRGRTGEVFLPSPRKFAPAGSLHAQAAAVGARGYVAAPALAGVASANQSNPAVHVGRGSGGAQATGTTRPASRTWVRPDGAQLQPPAADQQPVQAARPTAGLNGLRQPVPSLPHDGATGGVTTKASIRLPASKTWTRLDSALPAASGTITATAPAAKAQHTAGPSAKRLPQLGPSTKRVWRRDDSTMANSTAVPPESGGTSTAVGGHGSESRSMGGGASVTIVTASQPRPLETQRQPDVPSIPLRSDGAVTLARRPQSRTSQNPDLLSAVQHPGKLAAVAVAAGTTAAPAVSPLAAGQRSTVVASGEKGLRLPMRPVASSLHLPGARAKALGRTAQGRVSRPRSNKLQRIGEHLYREQRGAGGRTLQRQGATPTVPTRPARQVSRAQSVVLLMRQMSIRD